MKTPRRTVRALVCASTCLFLFSIPIHMSRSSDDPPPSSDKRDVPPEGSIVLNGDFVHNVGRLHMNVTNWGFMGSMPKSRYAMADVPSAQYPAGSGIEYMYAAGLWLGASKNGIPLVTTGYPETEWYPPSDRSQTIFRSGEGDPRGGSYPGLADDDGDGLVDEDWLNGLDDDGDGLIDEDFHAIGKQMFSCWYSDDQPQSRTVWPQHEPLGVRVRQKSFQWSEDQFEDFIGVRYTIDNIGDNFLSSLYVGLYADFDAGPRHYGSYHLDDMVGYWSGQWCARKGEAEMPVNIKLAYVHDADGDNGVTTSWFGIAILGNIPDCNGTNGLPAFPYSANMLNSFRVFRGLAPYIDGGDPTNDFERYDVLSQRVFDTETQMPADYRVLISVGPFSFLPPGSSIWVDFAFVAGDDFDDLRDNAAAAKLIWDGIWFDLDRNPQTGINGRESPIEGEIDDWDPDVCRDDYDKVDIPKGDTCWSNMDCGKELRDFRGPSDCYRKFDADLLYYQTGIDGREHNLHWVTGSAPPPPHIRLVPRDGAVEIYWDSFSEAVPDQMTLLNDFEGYQVWRADDWHRPLGTNENTGPARELWSLLESRDLVNGVTPDRRFDYPEEEGGWIYTPLKHVENLEEIIENFRLHMIEYPLDTIPCPFGMTCDERDTVEAIMRYRLGLPGGKRFYRHVDREAKNGVPYFYSVATYDHVLVDGSPTEQGLFSNPSASFVHIRARSQAQESDGFDKSRVFVVPNPVSNETMTPWRLEANNADPTGLRCEFRNLPACLSTIRIYTVSGDLVQTIHHDGGDGDGTAAWNLLSRNGQDVTSGVYIFSVAPEDGGFPRTVGKFTVIR